MKKTPTKKPVKPAPDRLPLALDSLRELGPDRLLFVIGGGVATSPSYWPVGNPGPDFD